MEVRPACIGFGAGLGRVGAGGTLAPGLEPVLEPPVLPVPLEDEPVELPEGPVAAALLGAGGEGSGVNGSRVAPWLW